jgi:hypothetical protein
VDAHPQGGQRREVIGSIKDLGAKNATILGGYSAAALRETTPLVFTRTLMDILNSFAAYLKPGVSECVRVDLIANDQRTHAICRHR